MPKNFTKIAFTESVKKVQEKFGSRDAYSRFEEVEKFELTQNEKFFIAERDSFYLATVGENGFPYLQHRGGPKGFLKILDDSTIGFADFSGNKQFISVGNINSTKKATLFLMDYRSKTRLKIWAESSILELDENPELLEKLRPKNYKANVERIIIFKIVGYDWNCPQHITERYTIEELERIKLKST